MAVRGHVNGMAGSCVVGWALAVPDQGNCVITITDDSGAVLATGRAALHRDDLVSVGVGRTNLAFRIPVECPAERRALHVLADGEELPGSPLLTGAGAYDSDVAVAAGRIIGWVTERVTGFEPPLIKVVNQHGAVVGQARAARRAGDDDPFDQPAHFDIELEDRCFGAGTLRLRLFAGHVKFAERDCELKIDGCLDSITDETYTGWLLAPDAPERLFAFEVFQDGLLAGTAQCALPRQDVRTFYPTAVTPGFALTLAKPNHAAVDATALSFRLRGSELDLFQGPYVVASRPAAVLAAQRAARLAHLPLDGLGPAERAIIQVALHDFVEAARLGEGFMAQRQAAAPSRATPGGAAPGRVAPGRAASASGAPRLTIIIPVFADVALTRACLQSVLATRNAATDHVVLIDDAAPDPAMAPLLEGFAGAANVFLLRNAENLGFVKTVNRGIGFALGGDVLLLNADTVLFPGGLDELCKIGALPGIGTVTALSNNATVFSYPHPEQKAAALEDVGWAELARLALAGNAGLAIDVPTGHGFCLLIKGAVLRRIGMLDEAFGRGYGEENDFCTRAAGWGYRNVAAAGVLVLHHESASFAGERAALLAVNEPRLRQAYPEFEVSIWTFQDREGLRRARWALDQARLRRAMASQAFVLLVTHSLEGGTIKAAEQIEAVAEAAGGEGTVRLTLRCRASGYLELACERPALLAVFAPDEIEPLFELLTAAAPERVMVHQLLGYPAAFIARIGGWARGMHSVFYVHDFYPLCPRVTMVDAKDEFCDVADTATCGRCVALGGAHPLSKLGGLTPAAHRALFASTLSGFRQIVAPSENAAGYMRRAFPELPMQAVPHPEPPPAAAIAVRDGDDDEIVLLGAIGAVKGSAKLLEMAKRARLSRPRLRFRVIGHTDIDDQLLGLGVLITGKYQPAELPGLVAQARGRLALFLQDWPETYSYTLSEAARFGFIPVVPDIGAPAERVRAAGFGIIYPFPSNAAQILQLLDEIKAERRPLVAAGVSAAGLLPGAEAFQKTVNILRNRQPMFTAGAQ